MLVPQFIPWNSIAFRSLLGEMLQGLRLRLTPSRQIEIQRFARLDRIALDEILDPAPFEAEWSETEADLVAVLGSDHLAHCTNPGDRRALYQLIRVLKPQNVLEVGTRFGVSALYIAAAIVLRHAFFPAGRKLWPNEKALTGCARALSRLQREGVPLAARPLGELPWPTKYRGRVTSLALIGRTS